LFVDARLIDKEILVTDVCIIGAGAAGIAMTLEFLNTSHNVILLESGGLERDEFTQRLYSGESVGMPYARLDECRSRFFGGGTNCWLGWCRPLDPIDFEPRPWMSSDGWPIKRDELIAAYERAHCLLELGPFDYDAASWQRRYGPKAKFLDYDQTIIQDGVNQISPPARFGRRFRADLQLARNVRTLLHATVTELVANSYANAVERVHVSSASGGKFVIISKLVVLATGGIENARLLLASSRRHAAGLGNTHDLVGRYFMDHPRVRSIRTVLAAPKARRLYDHSLALVRQRLGLGRRLVTIHFTPTQRQQRDLSLPNSRTYLVAASFSSLSALHGSLKCLLGHGQNAGAQWSGYNFRLDKLLQVAKAIPRGATAGLGFLLPFERRGREFYLETVFEPVPNRDSRITLISEKDQLGMRKVRLDWRLSEADRTNYLRSLEVVVAELAGQGIIIPLDPHSEAERRWPEHIQWCWHHIGTTRMAQDPSKGVVDANCRVHGMENLFVVGSSVFPTPGSDTPTLTVVALALRLASHLKSLVTRFQAPAYSEQIG
jgi:choline dehydrogenase-like flavoprotein